MFRYFWFSKEKSFLKNFLNLVFWFFILLSIFYFFSFRPTNQPVFSGITALLSALILTLPYLVYQNSRLKEIYSLKFPLTLELLAFFSLILSWLGTFIFYHFGFGYDSFVHFNVSWLGSVIAFLTIRGFSEKQKKKKLFVLIFLIVILGGLFNEFFKVAGDQWWGTEMAGEKGEPNDTWRDFVYDIFGALAGLALILLKGEKMIQSLKIL